jgi:hypothetical protein
MRKLVLLILIMSLFAIGGNAQTRTGDFEILLRHHSRFSKKTLDRFKSNVVYFSFGKII